ncbi:hypothetical protein HP287_005248, partial [Escherichia coli]|nr:hypothetical protein [Escherichia coli]
VRDLAGEKSLATSDVSGILNAPHLTRFGGFLLFIFGERDASGCTDVAG